MQKLNEYDTTSITRWAAFFHDGSLLRAQQHFNNIDLDMSSAEIDQEYPDLGLPVKKDNRIVGVLRLFNVQAIKINDRTCNEINFPDVCEAEILDFEVIDSNSILLGILVTSPASSSQTSVYLQIAIVAQKIVWENAVARTTTDS